MKRIAMATVIACSPFAATAETTQIDLSTLPGKTVYDSATLKPIAMTPDGKPMVVALHVAQGSVVPPHATSSGLRLLTVVDGVLYWGDGETVLPAEEAVYPTGSVLMVPSGQMHWLAAREGDLTLQLVVMPDDAPTAGVAKQLH